MRKLLIRIVIVIAVGLTMSILWMFEGRQLSLFVDRFGTVEMSSTPITSLTYEGNGTGGAILVNDLHLNLTPADSQIASPHVGTTKDEQLALSLGGKVFACGPLPATSGDAGENLSTKPPAGDVASLEIRHSVVGWITPFNLNFMTGQSPSRIRHVYYRLIWKKQSGAKLEMLWRYEQHYLPPNGWGSGFMTREDSTGLIRIDIGT
jgi:hypothetical protein